MGIELTYPASILMTAGLLGFLQQTMAMDWKSKIFCKTPFSRKVI